MVKESGHVSIIYVDKDTIVASQNTHSLPYTVVVKFLSTIFGYMTASPLGELEILPQKKKLPDALDAIENELPASMCLICLWALTGRICTP